MPTAETKDVMQAYLDALLARGDFARYLAEDVVWTSMDSGDEVRGREAVAGFITMLHVQLFDAHPQLRSLVVEGDTAALEAIFVGTHTGEMAGIPPTGAEVRVPYVVVYTVADGLISELRGYLPMAVLIGQLQAAAPATV